MALTQMQQQAIWNNGRCKCPRCGKFRKPEDFPDQPAAAHLGDETMRIRVSLLPGCRECLNGDAPDGRDEKR